MPAGSGNGGNSVKVAGTCNLIFSAALTDFEAEGYKHSFFRELGIRLLNSLAYNARAKTIERAFRDMMQQFDKMFPDYLGSRPGQRNQAADYYDSHPEELPSLEQFCRTFGEWLQEYHERPKGGGIHRGRSPREIWETRSRGGCMPLSVERLKMAFLKPEAVRTVGRGPSVKWDNEFYYCDKLTWGSKVLVKLCIVKLNARREEQEVHLLLQKDSGAFNLTKSEECI